MIINTQTFEKYTEKSFRAKFSNMSLPLELSDSFLRHEGYAILHTNTNVPEIRKYETLTETEPKEIDGKWYTQYDVSLIEFVDDEQKNAFIKSWKYEIKSKLSQSRYTKEISGVKFEEKFFSTNRETRAQLFSEFNSMKNGFINIINWKTTNGEWVELNLEKMTELCSLISNHVQNCFNEEKLKLEQLEQLVTIDELDNFQI